MASAEGQQQTIDVADLDVPQLQDVRQQLEQELKHLTSSFGQLKGAQAKFKSCIESLQSITPASTDKTSLIPLTPSLYVSGKLSDADKVIVDVGTGYYVEKPIAAARKMYEEKISFVTKNLEQLQETIQKKQDNMRVVSDVMKVKMMQSQRAGASVGESTVQA
ncbi:Prefoldin alpha subunit [Tilletiaria anomala UBC 951]|uniref:Prefoldin alpha subunit n=1 Tax=Tilletiaria anomala (strain ATCC 24038 / CBS 436.72 / UBC 951) TaxID=1037660 RepID=A0A066W662_TILAU|nr:Prefoldin alpha subunit [Tilletiaria anomala UBC 951]KDN46260.1 Prefoldin alpha subunit [Tilletiaria anomala UBC 951]